MALRLHGVASKTVSLPHNVPRAVCRADSAACPSLHRRQRGRLCSCERDAASANGRRKSCPRRGMVSGCSSVRLVLWVCMCITNVGTSSGTQAQESVPVRCATFNCSLNRDEQGKLQSEVSDDSHPQIRNVARILRSVRPDIVLLNEVDHSPGMAFPDGFRKNYLQSDNAWCDDPPLHLPFACWLPVNTGVDSGTDLDHDGEFHGPGDSIGYGRFPGQYGMLLLSRFPIQQEQVRTFQHLLWRSLPGAALPVKSDGSGASWYSESELASLRLSSKSHWDVPIRFGEQTLHILASHPTPPAFDGPEDRNGRRNHDEIRLWAEYLSDTNGTATWLRDDNGVSGGLPSGSHFVIMGDLNADPVDGGSFRRAISQLLQHPRVNSLFTPVSEGAIEAARTQAGANQQHMGNPAADTADFNDRSVGNLRVDYVLPSATLGVRSTEVFWPDSNVTDAAWLGCSDHRLVWLDLVIPE
jgi:endonuclease/exonuclease/phosphatase family metal-dependent hydrolase